MLVTIITPHPLYLEIIFENLNNPPIESPRINQDISLDVKYPLSRLHAKKRPRRK